MDKLSLNGDDWVFPTKNFTELPKPDGLEVSVRVTRMDHAGEIFNSADLVAKLVFVIQTTGLDEWLKSKAWDLAAAYVSKLFSTEILNRPKTRGLIEFKAGDRSFTIKVDDVTKLHDMSIRHTKVKKGELEFDELIIAPKPVEDRAKGLSNL